MSSNPEAEAARRAVPPEPRRRLRRTLLILALLLGILVAGLVGTVAWVLVNAQRALDKSTNGHGGSVIEVFLPPAQTSAPASTRFTVLIAGNSFDDPGHAGADLTDSIMLATIDQATSKTALVSIPRDLMVEYGGSRMKINAVYVSAGRGDAGLTALGEVAERVSGLHVDKHVLIGVTAFKDMVDAVGGVDLVIKSPDPRGIADPNVDLTLPNGPQHLDGATALKLARARNHPVAGKPVYGLPQSDYSRQQSQRLILAAVVDKLKSSETLANPLTIINIFNALADYMSTDLTAAEIRSLFGLVLKSGTPVSFTVRGTSSDSYLTGYSAPGLGDALIPKAGMFDYSAIQGYVKAQLA